jgi:hypothetical protein
VAHAGLLNWQRKACEDCHIPLPPDDSYLTHGSGWVFDWRRPGRDQLTGPDTPVSFRWRFGDGRLVMFAAYGWRQSEYEMGKPGASSRIKSPFYGILEPEERDSAAVKEIPGR